MCGSRPPRENWQRARRWNLVTGPDEYNAIVNNNAYTNSAARENLRYAAQTVEALRATAPDVYNALVHKAALEPSEVEAWRFRFGRYLEKPAK